MAFVPRPHTSAALQHLRRSVVALALLLAGSVIAHAMCWCVLHFTEARTVHLEADSRPREVTVITRGPGDTKVAQKVTLAPGAVVSENDRGPVEVNRHLSATDRVLRAVIEISTVVGLMSSIGLVVVMLQGVSVAAGASVPGVEMAVTASTWSLVIAMLCVPMSKLAGAVPFEGLFAGYASLVEGSRLFNEGGPTAPGPFAYYAVRVGLPLLVLGALAACVLRFRIGVERGVIITSVSQIDERLEREIRSARLGQLPVARAVGALNQAIGDPVAHAEESPVAAAVESHVRAASAGVPHEDGPRNMRSPGKGKPLGRPI